MYGPLGFFSYATEDDHRDNGRISELRDMLEREVRAHGLPEFHLFQDKSGIEVGDKWEERIRAQLGAATVLVPVLTPTFFTRDWCKREVDHFLARPELTYKRLTVYPLYLIRDLVWEAPRRHDPLRKILHTFQVRDIRELRHQDITTGTGRKCIAQLGEELAGKLLEIQWRQDAAERALGLLRDRRFSEAAADLKGENLTEEAIFCERLAGELSAGRPQQAAALLSEAPPGWMDEGWRWVGEWLGEEQKAEGERAKREEEARRQEQARLAELAHREAARKAEEARQAEEARKAAEAARQAEEARQAAEAARQAEIRRAVEAARQAEEVRKAAEAARQVEEARKAAEAARQAEEARKVADAARQAEEARLAAFARHRESARSSAPYQALLVDRTGAAWNKRTDIVAQLASTTRDPMQALAILQEYQTTTRNGADLWFIRDTLLKIAAGQWRGTVSTELRRQAKVQATQIFSHIPLADLDRAKRMICWVEIPKDSGKLEYLAGSPTVEANRDVDEEQHRVRFARGFWVMDVPVTNVLYECFDPAHRADRDSFGGRRPEKDQDHVPAYNLTWYEAQMFAEWIGTDADSAGSRLPLEAEWEYFCRAGSTSTYWAGATEAELGVAGWYSGNAGGHPHAVRKKKPNAWGLYDCHGNVWEWCLDEFRAYSTHRILLDPREIQECPSLLWAPESGILVKPGASRVVRGGSWINDAQAARSALRNFRLPKVRHDYLGFRLVRPLPRA